jgi:hypothetical protein
VTPLEALRAAEEAGVRFRAEGARLRASKDAVEGLPSVVRESLHQHREQIAAVLRLREVHRGWGLSDDEVAMVEAAMLDGRVGKVVIVPSAPGARVA